LKIIDFGISNKLQTDHTSIATFNPKGTLNFISPETIRPDAMGRVKVLSAFYIVNVYTAINFGLIIF